MAIYVAWRPMGRNDSKGMMCIRVTEVYLCRNVEHDTPHTEGDIDCP